MKIENENVIKNLVAVAFLVLLMICGSIIIGVYMSKKWEKIRDVRRIADAQQVIKAIDAYYFNNNKLPENESSSEWDKSYDPKTSNQTLFNSLRSSISQVFDPINKNEFYYRYHKFSAGEYGCDKSFAVFQVMSFERKMSNNGFGSCPGRDFVKEAPNGFTVQWFE